MCRPRRDCTRLPRLLPGENARPLPGNLASRNYSGKRLTRVGENSACKLIINSTERYPLTAHCGSGSHPRQNNDIQSVCDKLTV
jgi:hypothetical protein